MSGLLALLTFVARYGT